MFGSEPRAEQFGRCGDLGRGVKIPYTTMLEPPHASAAEDREYYGETFFDTSRYCVQKKCSMSSRQTFPPPSQKDFSFHPSILRRSSHTLREEGGSHKSPFLPFVFFLLPRLLKSKGEEGGRRTANPALPKNLVSLLFSLPRRGGFVG